MNPIKPAQHSLIRRIRQYIGRLAQGMYHAVPCSQRCKFSIKRYFFRAFGFLLKNTDSYRAWRVFEAGIDQTKTSEPPPSTAPREVKDQYIQQILAIPEKHSSYQTLREPSVPAHRLTTRAIAFYLPQFHPISENDQWWGKGFTEWTNVSKAVPQFIGHEQPKLPDELGFYDLRLPEIMQRQIELAKHAGLGGFCFYYYWFDGHRLLEKPLEQFLNSKHDFPFCLCWANENWTRRWDGMDDDILMEQHYNETNDLKFIQDLAPYLRDARYIRVDGKPLLILYRPSLLPDATKTIARWRKFCRAEGIGELFLCMVQFDTLDPAEYGFDAAIEFPPHKLGKGLPAQNDRLQVINPNYQGYVIQYDDIILNAMQEAQPPHPLIRGVYPNWDNEARKPGRGFTTIDSTPTKYRAWLRHAVNHAQRHPVENESLVFINAWNEWAEGAYLEPDRRHGYAYLNATTQALCLPRASVAPTQITLIIHAYYPELLPEIFEYLRHWTLPYRALITVPNDGEKHTQAQQLIAQHLPNATIELIPQPNRGRDILPFLQTLGRLDHNDQLILKIHTKKSLHRSDGDVWRHDLYQKLLAPAQVEAIWHAFQSTPALGLVAPQGHLLGMSTYWGSNERRVKALLKQITPTDHNLNNEIFSAGSMFYIRRAALAALTTLNLQPQDFEEEFGQTDGTLAHAIERLFVIAAWQNGYHTADSANPTWVSYAPSQRFHHAAPSAEPTHAAH